MDIQTAWEAMSTICASRNSGPIRYTITWRVRALTGTISRQKVLAKAIQWQTTPQPRDVSKTAALSWWFQAISSERRSILMQLTRARRFRRRELMPHRRLLAALPDNHFTNFLAPFCCRLRLYGRVGVDQ